MNPLQVPQQGPLWRELPFLHLSQIPHKNFPKQRNFFPSLKGPRKGASLRSPKTGTLWKQPPISRVLLSISFGVPSKGAIPPGSPHRAPSERDALFLVPSFTPLSKSSVYEPTSSFPSRGWNNIVIKNSVYGHLLLSPHVTLCCM